MLVASISGVITGVFGGILRDIFCNDIPLVFRRELYASVSFAAAWFYLGCVHFKVPAEQAMLLTLFGGFWCACWQSASIGKCPSFTTTTSNDCLSAGLRGWVATDLRAVPAPTPHARAPVPRGARAGHAKLRVQGW